MFRAATTLIEFTVVATDRNGNPVTDLKQDDLVVTEDGQSRDIAFFRFDGGIEKRDTEPLGPGLFTNRSEYLAGPPRNVIAILIDSVFTEPSQQVEVRSQLIRYLDGIPPNTRVGIYQAGYRIEVLHEFTSDLATLRSRIKSLLAATPAHAQKFDDGKFVATDDLIISPEVREAANADMKRLVEQYQESSEDRKRTAALASLELVGDHLAGIPGRKSLVWITVGMPVHSTYDSWTRVHDAQVRRTAERLASRGIVIYPVDAQGLKSLDLGTTSVERRSSRGGPPPRTQLGLPDQRLWTSQDILATVTGGRVSKNSNDMTNGIKNAAADLRGSYSVGFYSIDAPDNAWRRLAVKTTRRDVRLTHREGYLAYAPAAASLEWSDAQWRWAVWNPVGSTALHLDARFEAVKGAETHNLIVLIAPEELQFRRISDRSVADVQIAIAEKADGGAFTYRTRDVAFTLPEGSGAASAMMRFTDRWKLNPQTSTVRLILRDRTTGRYGTLDMTVR